MLQLTENATTVVKSIAEQQEDTIGIRITADSADAPLTVAAVANAETEDQLVEQDGATVYLNAGAAQQLDDKVLDAGVDDAGSVKFALAQQA